MAPGFYIRLKCEEKKRSKVKYMDKPEPKVKNIRVSFFQRCIPHYRLSIFRKLQEKDGISFTICASESDKDQDFLKTSHKEKGFPFVNIKTYQMPLYPMTHCVTFQPYAVWCTLARKYDVIIMPDDFLDISSWLALFLGRLLCVPVCLFGHGRSLRCVDLSYRLRGWMMRLARAGINYTEGSREQWIKRGIRPEKLFVAYNALDTIQSDTLRKSITEQELTAFQKEKGLFGKKTVLFCGRILKDWKKPHILILAIKQVVQIVPDAKAVIIGDGPDRQELEDLVSRLGLTQYIDIAGPIFDEQVLAKYMLSSKVQVIPGNAGLGIQHAFAYGLPFITNDDAGTQTPEIELIQDGVNGYLCRDEDVDDFADKIKRILCDQNLQSHLAANAYKMIAEKYNIHKQAEGFFAAVGYCENGKG